MDIMLLFFLNKVHLVDDHACVHSSVYNDSKQRTFYVKSKQCLYTAII